MTHTPATCTVTSAVHGACGKPAVWSDGRFAECAEHAADVAALAKASPARAAYAVGDPVEIERHGKRYVGRVSRVGARGAVYAEVVYGNGARREVRV